MTLIHMKQSHTIMNRTIVLNIENTFPTNFHPVHNTYCMNHVVKTFRFNNIL